MVMIVVLLAISVWMYGQYLQYSSEHKIEKVLLAHACERVPESMPEDVADLLDCEAIIAEVSCDSLLTPQALESLGIDCS